MALKTTPVCNFGEAAHDFKLKDTRGRSWTLQDCMGPQGVLVAFISNHCPYVKAIRKKLVRDCQDLAPLGIHAVAIMPNDTLRYPEDGLDRMRAVALEYEFPFPYLLDETQDVARRYGAVCTPDFFGYNAQGALQYRGRLDAAGGKPDDGELPRELFDAMRRVAETGHGPEQQFASMGCSIKWKEK